MPPFDHRYSPGYRSPDTDIAALKAAALTLGGDRFQYDGVLEDQLTPACREAILARGRRFGKGTYIAGYPTSRCHDNVFAHLEKIGFAPGFEPYIGLALAGDGIWRVHSWLVARDKMAVDVTVPGMRVYFGVPWSDGMMSLVPG
jgi:hypothetical protein